tara:strand:- start:94 stop:576 length:483 start_codon:yes stop_codon:yes gene_type:complete
MSQNKVFDSLDDLNNVISKLPKDSVIVYTYGAWDLLHPGHIRFMERASKLGDFLVVGVVADNPIKDLKGKDRPVQSQDDRLAICGNLICLDAVVPQPEYDPSEILSLLDRVDILTKGDDWEYIPGTKTIEKLGGKLVKLVYSEGFSTSKLVSKIKKYEEK